MKIHTGNNLESLKSYPDNYFDAIVTDPPYGLGKEPDATEMLKAWIETGYLEVKGSGFMGKEWDAFVPQPIFWKEVFRVLKHGGHVLSFFGTRTYDWGVMSMRLAGFEIRDQIAWCYGSGFPKSHNISKAIDKMYGAEREIVGEKIRGDIEKAKQNGSGYLSDPANKNNEKQFGYGTELITKASTEEAKQWDGWGSALKPAIEPIVLARKPLEKGLSIAENVLKWGTGAINIDGCRINTNDDLAKNYKSVRKSDDEMGERGYKMGFRQGKDSIAEATESTSLGRFPANIILTHHPECECIGTKKVKGSNCSPEDIGKGDGENMFGIKGKITASHTDENGEETVEDWDCHEDCPIKIMDEQSGFTQSQKSMRGEGGGGDKVQQLNYRKNTLRGHSDKGGASRFFYVAKASKAERNKGLEHFEEKRMEGRDQGQDERSVAFKARPTPMANIHPTVKPIKLMQYLVRLITPPNGIVLDPFMGSGTTGVACKLEGFDFVGMEQDAEYSKIAQARIENYVEEKEKKKLKEGGSESNQTSIFS